MPKEIVTSNEDWLLVADVTQKGEVQVTFDNGEQRVIMYFRKDKWREWLKNQAKQPG